MDYRFTSLKKHFIHLVEKADPDALTKFMIWLDGRLAEFKVKGKMNLNLVESEDGMYLCTLCNEVTRRNSTDFSQLNDKDKSVKNESRNKAQGSNSSTTKDTNSGKEEDLIAEYYQRIQELNKCWTGTPSASFHAPATGEERENGNSNKDNDHTDQSDTIQSQTSGTRPSTWYQVPSGPSPSSQGIVTTLASTYHSLAPLVLAAGVNADNGDAMQSLPLANPLTFHVTYNSSKKVVCVDDVRYLGRELIQQFNIPLKDQEAMVVQYFDSVWEDWVDIDDIRKLRDKEKLKLSIQRSREATTFFRMPAQLEQPVLTKKNKSSSSITVKAGKKQPKEARKSPEPAKKESPTPIPRVTSPGLSSDVSSASQWPYPFQLPLSSLKRSLREALEGNKPLNKMQRGELLSTMYEEITKYTFYPTPCQYREVAERLLQEFPYLRGQQPPSEAISQWKKHLSMKFRNVRKRQDSEVPAVLLKRFRCRSRSRTTSTEITDSESPKSATTPSAEQIAFPRGATSPTVEMNSFPVSQLAHSTSQIAQLLKAPIPNLPNVTSAIPTTCKETKNVPNTADSSINRLQNTGNQNTIKIMLLPMNKNSNTNNSGS